MLLSPFALYVLAIVSVSCVPSLLKSFLVVPLRMYKLFRESLIKAALPFLANVVLIPI